MKSITAEGLQQKIDELKGWNYILISGRMEKDSKFPDFWKIDHALNGYYTVSGPDFITFGEKLTVERKGDGFFAIKITNESGAEYEIVGWCYIKNVYKITISTPEASA